MAARRSTARGIGTGRKSDKPWMQALRRVALMTDPKTKKRYIDALAFRCFKDAIAGDNEAMQEIGDRLDGKTIVIEGDADNPVQLFQRIERVIVDVSNETEVVSLDPHAGNGKDPTQP